MAGGDTVTTIFGGDDGAFAAAAAKVRGTMAAIAGFAPEMRFFAAGKKGAESLGTAAHGAAGGIHALSAALGPLAAGLAALAGVATIFEGFKKSLEEASKVETAKFNFTAVAGGAEEAEGAIKKLEATSKETATSFATLAGGAKSLIEAGLDADQAADATERLQKIALNTGSDFQELGEIYARIQTKQEISSKDLVKLAMTGIPGIAELGHQFRNLERDTKDSNAAIEQNLKTLDRTYQLNEKNVSGITSFATRIGLTKDAFAAFANGMGVSSAVAGQLGSGFSKIAGTLNNQFSDGLRQISKETGVSTDSLMEFAREGKLGYEDLIQAAARYRQEKEEKAKQEGEDQKLRNETNLLEQQRSLIGQVSAAIKSATDEGGIFANVNKFFETWKGKLQELSHAVEEVFVNFGAPLIDALKPAIDYLTAQGPAVQKMATDAGTALSGAIRWFIDAVSTGTFWSQVSTQGAAAFDAAMQPIKELGAKIAQAFGALNKNNELVQGFLSISKLLDGIADHFGIKIMQALSGPLRQLAEFDVSGREKADATWLKYVPGMPKMVSPEEEGLTHEERVERTMKQWGGMPDKADRDAAERELQESTEGIKTHFPAALQQGIEAFQTSPDIARSHREFDRDVAAGRTPYFVRPDVAARDYQRETGQKQPDWMSPQTAERIAQLLEQQNSLLRTLLTAG